MFMIPTANNVSIAEFHQSELVNFPVWVLLQCGLKVGSFNTHGDGIERLSALEIDAESWTRWFQKVVLSEHIGFQLQQDGVNFFVNKRRTAFNTSPFIYDGMTAFETSLEQTSSGVLERYYEVLGQLSSEEILSSPAFQRVENPVDLWQGSQSTRSELLMLWKRYKARPYYRVHHADDLNRQMVRSDVLCEKINNILRDALSTQDRFVMVNFVNYPESIFAIASSSIIIGLNVDAPFPVDDFMWLFAEAMSAIVA